MSGDKAKAKSAYQDFLTLWKDADPDLPVLKQAQANTPSCNNRGELRRSSTVMGGNDIYRNQSFQ